MQRCLQRTDILGVVLAGGQSRRFGTDKADAQLNGSRLIEHVVKRAAPQAGTLAISGRDYGLGLPVIADAMPSEGPLTGVLSALQWAEDAGFPAIATFSCDAPFFPLDLVARLVERLSPGLDCSYVSVQGRRHPVFALWRTSLLARLQAIYLAGTRSLMTAQDQTAAVMVAFAYGSAPCGDPFFNINRQDDQDLAQVWLDAR